MLRNKILLFGLSLILASGSLSAQSPDSIAFPVDSLMVIVLEQHPMAQKARLIEEQARAAKLKASGAFDPKLFSEVEQKRYSDYLYYSLHNSGLEIPAWFGFKAKAGYELNEGVYLNNENTVPASGLWYGDISWTLGQGLFLDERRASLKQARLLEESAEFEIQLALNELLNNALQAYWDWYAAYQEYNTYQQAYKMAKFRFEALKRSALIGDKPAIDTLESLIQVQDRQIKLQAAEAQIIQTRNHLNTFLWLEGRIPLELSTKSYPQFELGQIANPLPADWYQKHPALQAYALKIEGLEIDKRLNQEILKPDLTVHYKFLNAPTQNDFFSQYSTNNYAWGLKASFPLFIRKGRGEVLKSKLKIQETELDLDLKQIQIQNKVEALSAELSLLIQQLNNAQKMRANYARLLEAENIKFRNGESSLFLVNSRELKYIDSLVKQFQLEAKVKATQAKLEAEAAVLYN